MNTHTFSSDQATHALEIVLWLMKERRFFLFRQGDYSLRIEGDLGHGLDPSVFLPALQLEDAVCSVYATTAKMADMNISTWERSLGVAPPDLSGKKQVVLCNRFTGLLDICRVYPATAFTQFLPLTLDDLRSQEVARLMGGKSNDDYSSNELKELGDQAEENARKIWEEVEAIKVLESGNACVVLLKTRIEPQNKFPSDDLLGGKLDGIQLFPHGLGYLFYEYSKRVRIMRHSFAIFGTSYKDHVVVHHWTDGQLGLRHEKHSTYSCKVYVPIVL